MFDISKKLILGTVQLGLNYGVNNTQGKPSRQEAFAILDEASAQGIKYLDTAAAYGDSEQIIGAFHKESKKKFSLITKFHADEPLGLHQIVESAIKRLDIPFIDILFFHSYKDFKSNLEMLKNLRNEVEKGKIQKIGVSVYTNEEIEDLLNFPEVEVIQAPFNLLDNDGLRGEIFEKAKEKGKIIHTRSVFLQGLFFKKLDMLPVELSPLKGSLQEVKNLAREANHSMASLALNYAINKTYIDGVLVGVDNVSQLKSNLSSLHNTLTLQVEKIIDNIKINDKSLLNPATWKIK